MFYQPDVDLCISWSAGIEAQLSGNVVSGGMDWRQMERDTVQQMNHATPDQSSLVYLRKRFEERVVAATCLLGTDQVWITSV